MPALIWLFEGGKPGDDAQARAIADALERPYRRLHLEPKPEWVLGKPPFRPTLDHLDLTRSDRLEPPWPDLIITVGRRPTAAALWVKERSPETRLVVVGRPKRWPDRFDLIVAPAQFRVDGGANVIALDLPLIGVDPARVAMARTAWAERLAGLPRPLTAVFVGGQTKPFRFDGDVARDLLRRLQPLAAEGSLYVTTSRRTGPDVVAALEGGLPPGQRLYAWTPDSGDDNPYLGLLAWADRFVVTGDSISMMVEVARLGRPLAVFQLPYAPDLGTRLRRLAVTALDPRDGKGVLGGLGRALARAGITGYGRDLEALHRWLFERGMAVPLGQPFRPPRDGLALDLVEVRARVDALLAPR
ncbi:MAG: ELM1/GtrOC1 family putative glycosyltransferase [Geminicoccaceae bacterium]